MSLPKLDATALRRLYFLGYEAIWALETDRGILASSVSGLFGFVFGRDSAIVGLQLLAADERAGTKLYFGLVRKILFGLAGLQGIETNIENGEEPGKIIHDFRPQGDDYFQKQLSPPWYTYPDGSLRSFDSVDGTPLFLMLAAKYFAYYGASEDHPCLPHIVAACRWLLGYADTNGDGLIDYRIHPDRKHGGLRVQNWMDMDCSLFHEDGAEMVFPIAPVEVQAYAWCALRAWADIFSRHDPLFARQLAMRAALLRKFFNKRYPFESAQGFALASNIDGAGRRVMAVRSNMGHVLWASWKDMRGRRQSILDARTVPLLVRRLMAPDLFEPKAGIRTLSALSAKYDPYSCVNGSFWPHDNCLIAQGLENFGYRAKARRIRRAYFKGLAHFGSPVELFCYDGEYKRFGPPTGDRAAACSSQAWSAAAMVADTLALLADA